LSTCYWLGSIQECYQISRMLAVNNSEENGLYSDGG
jgi:hypothetical protein